MQRFAHHGVDHLLVKLRIRLAGIEAAVHRDQRVVEVDRVVETLVRGVVVDDGNPLTDGARGELLVAHCDRLHVAAVRPRLGPNAYTFNGRNSGGVTAMPSGGGGLSGFGVSDGRPPTASAVGATCESAAARPSEEVVHVTGPHLERAVLRRAAASP